MTAGGAFLQGTKCPTRIVAAAPELREHTNHHRTVHCKESTPRCASSGSVKRSTDKDTRRGPRWPCPGGCGSSPSRVFARRHFGECRACRSRVLLEVPHQKLSEALHTQVTDTHARAQQCKAGEQGTLNREAEERQDGSGVHPGSRFPHKITRGASLTKPSQLFILGARYKFLPELPRTPQNTSFRSTPKRDQKSLRATLSETPPQGPEHGHRPFHRCMGKPACWRTGVQPLSAQRGWGLRLASRTTT